LEKSKEIGAPEVKKQKTKRVTYSISQKHATDDGLRKKGNKQAIVTRHVRVYFTGRARK
jgi:hypothetical protein